LHNLLRFNWVWLAAFSGLALEFARYSQGVLDRYFVMHALPQSPVHPMVE
jgi:hypothetical protein